MARKWKEHMEHEAIFHKTSIGRNPSKCKMNKSNVDHSKSIAVRENNMKWMLVVYICSGIAGECRTPPEYPAIKDTYYECVQDGLGDAYEILFGSDSIFTPEMILNSQLYPQYKCTPVKDQGKITT